MVVYVFFFALALLLVLFATVQDLRIREIANWLTYSLVALVLFFRAIYAVWYSDLSFFLYGFFGVMLFVLLGYLLYYAGVFAGGDAKLLFGLGGILPYSSVFDYFSLGLFFVFVLFAAGVVYTLLYSVWLVAVNSRAFARDFSKRFFAGRFVFIGGVGLGFLLALFASRFYLSPAIGFIGVAFPLLFFYVKSIEAVCMIRTIHPSQLTEGDWLHRDVRVAGRTIKKTVHGVTYAEVVFLRKHAKRVTIRTGVPFAPAFLITLVIFFFVLFR
jgi:Flp pilus assembly protein protease CpaA